MFSCAEYSFIPLIETALWSLLKLGDREEEKSAKCLEGYFSEFYDDFFESKLVNLHPSETSVCMLI